MDLTKVLDELRRELDYLDSAILSLERLQAKSVRRRGRTSKVIGELNRSVRSELKRNTGHRRIYGRQP
jgi:hypothetical protein